MSPMFRKKPLEVEAHLWTRNGDHPLDYAHEIVDPVEAREPQTYSPEYQRINNWEGQLVRYFRHPDHPSHAIHEDCGHVWHFHGWIDTGRYGHVVCPGSWIVKDAEGEFYPVKPSVFTATYEPISEHEQENGSVVNREWAAQVLAKLDSMSMRDLRRNLRAAIQRLLHLDSERTSA